MSRLPISAADMAAYRAGARKRRQQREEMLKEHRLRARKLADQAAELLKKEFGAVQVLVFGMIHHLVHLGLMLALNGILKNQTLKIGY